MNSFFLSFGVFTFLFALGIRFIPLKNFSKYLQKPLKKTKTFFLIIGILGVLFGWFFVEEAFLSILPFLWGIHLFLFVGLLGYIGYSSFQEKRRIEGAERRRKEKEKAA